MTIRVLTADEYNPGDYLNAMCTGGPGHGKSVGMLSLLDGVAGDVCSELVFLSTDVGGLAGVKACRPGESRCRHCQKGQSCKHIYDQGSKPTEYVGRSSTHLFLPPGQHVADRVLVKFNPEFQISTIGSVFSRGKIIVSEAAEVIAKRQPYVPGKTVSG